MKKLPPFVKIGSICLKLESYENTYFYQRYAGNWSIGYQFIEGKLCANSKGYDERLNHLDKEEFAPCSEEEWQKDNMGYLP